MYLIMHFSGREVARAVQNTHQRHPAITLQPGPLDDLLIIRVLMSQFFFLLSCLAALLLLRCEPLVNINGSITTSTTTSVPLGLSVADLDGPAHEGGATQGDGPEREGLRRRQTQTDTHAERQTQSKEDMNEHRAPPQQWRWW